MSPEEQKYIDAKFESVTQRFDTQDELLTRMDHAIYGNGEPGLKVVVAGHAKTLKLAKRIGWTILTPILVAVGTGLVTGAVYLIHVIK